MKFTVSPSVRRLWLVRIIETAVGVGLVCAVVFGVGFLQTKRAKVVAAQLALEQEPQLLTQQEVARLELKKHEHDITRLQALFVPREAIDSFLNTIETAAAGHNVTVRIPDIQERVVIGKDK